MSNLAVAANPPVHTGPAPASAGDSSPTVAPADAAGGRDKVFSFPVTIFATATISGTLEDEARNTIGCDMRNSLADESSVELENGGTLTFTGFALADVAHATGSNARHEAPAMLAMLRKMIPSNVCLTNPNIPDNTILPMDVPIGDLRKIAAILARIDGKA